MPNFSFPFSGRQGHNEQPAKGHRELQTVEEVDYERHILQFDNLQDVTSHPGGPSKLEPNPSQRPLGRRAHDPLDAYGRASETVTKRSIYAQEGDTEPSDFKETVAELLKEEEYGVFRLIVPSVEVGRSEFEEYVSWLNKHQRAEGGQPWRRSIYCLPVIPPFSLPALVWTCLITAVDLTWTAFGVPINVAFCSVNYGQLHTGCTGSDLSFGIIYTLNLLISLNLGMMVVNGHRKKVVLDGRRVAWYYIRYGRFILDLAATVPFVYLVVILAISGGMGYRAKWVNAVSLIRLVRLLRLVSVSKVIYIDSTLGADGWLSRYVRLSTLYVMMVGFQILVLINLFACVLVLLAYMHGLDNSWMTAVSWTDVPDSSRFYQWYSAMYWVVTTTTTTGFGDFSPRWWAEQVVIGMAMVGGMIAFGILVGSVANALARADTTASRLQNHIRKISQVNKWLSTCDMKGKTKLQIQEYFAQLYVAKQSVAYGEAELFADLPPYLQFEVAGDLTLPLVQKVHAFKDLNLDAQQLIAAHLRPLRATVGQQLCRQGDESDRLWLLASGRLVALRHKETPQHVSAPALVGESLILAIDIPQCRHRPWTIRAALPCQLWELRLSDLSRVIQIYPAVRLSLLDHVRKELVESLWADQGEEPEEPLASLAQDWCELASLLHKALLELQEVDPAALDGLCIELSKATIEDGSLQARLSEVVEAAMVRDGLAPEALLGLPLFVQRQAAAQQQLQPQPQGLASERPSANGARARPGSRGGEVPAYPAAALRRGGGGGGGGGGAGSLGHRGHLHDSHYGPAPWGLTTEDVLASSGRVGGGSASPLTLTPPSAAGAPSLPPPKPVQQLLQQAQQAQPTQQQQQHAPMLQKEGNKSWHGRASPPRPPQQNVGATLLPPLMKQQQQLVRPMRRVASHNQGLHAVVTGRSDRTSVTIGGSDGYSDLTDVTAPSGLVTPDGIYRHTTAPPQMITAAVLDLSPAGSAAVGGGGGGGDVSLVVRPRSAPPSPPLDIPNDDPIGLETDFLSPKAQQRLRDQHQHPNHDHGHHPPPLLLPQQQQQQEEALPGEQLRLPLPPQDQHQHQPPLREAEGLEGPFGSEVHEQGQPAAAAAAAAAGPPTTINPVHRISGPTGPAAFGTTGPVARRSVLSRVSSPFASITAAAAMAAAGQGCGGAAATSAGSVTLPAGAIPTSATAAAAAPTMVAAAFGSNGNSGPGNGEGRYVARALSGPSGTCTTCGACFCPQCGAWTTPGGAEAVAPPPPGAHVPAPYPHIHPHVQPQATLAPIITTTSIGGAPPAMSLIDAIRGGGGAATAAVSGSAASGTGGIGIGGGGATSTLRRRSGAPWLAPQLNVPPSPRHWATTGGNGLDSPTRMLSRRSRMFGRSYAATNRADSLIRNTLMRDTLWNASSRDEEELASPSLPTRMATGDE